MLGAYRLTVTPAPVQDLAAVEDATERLLAAVVGLDDAAARRASLLPGWSVGHVLTHLARNADGMVRLVSWAHTGERTPMYASLEARSADIESGSSRQAVELVRDLECSARLLSTALGSLRAAPPQVLDRLVVFGAAAPDSVPDVPAHAIGYARLREVEIHHVDLDLPTYTPLDWPDDFVERTLLWIHGRSGPVDVIGHPAEVLAWRLGRGAGPSVLRRDGSAPGEPPAW